MMLHVSIHLYFYTCLYLAIRVLCWGNIFSFSSDFWLAVIAPLAQSSLTNHPYSSDFCFCLTLLISGWPDRAGRSLRQPEEAVQEVLRTAEARPLQPYSYTYY